MIRIIILRLLETYFRHRWLWLLPILGMMGFAGLSVVTATDSYMSLSAVYVNKESLLASLTSIREDGFSWVTPAQAAVDQFKELLQTDAYIRSVIQATDLEAQMAEGPQVVAETLAQARASVWVNILGKNTIVIGAMHEQPQIAQQLVQGVIDVFIQWQINSDREQSAAALTFLEELTTSYQEDVTLAEDNLMAYLDAHPEPLRDDRPASEQVEINRLDNKLAQALDRYNQSLDKLESAQLNSAVAENKVRQTYLVLDAPRFPLEPTTSTKSVVMNAVIFVVVGGVLSVFGIAGGALLDRSLRFPEDVRHLLELPVLTSLPYRPPPKTGRRKPNKETS